MKTKLFAPVLLLCMVFSAGSFACDAPAPPKIPKGKTSSEAEMVDAKKSVDTFLKAANAYLECAPSSRLHDRMVTKMENTGLKFNLALRRFKSANS